MEIFTTIIYPLIVIALGSSALNFVTFLIQRWDKKKEAKKESPIQALSKKVDGIKNDLDVIRKESDLGDCRSQLLILMEHHPDDTFQIMQVAKHYFVDLDGDWYMSALFKKHCKEHSVLLPNWFNDDTI